jgi:hypothetical protein
MDNGLIFPYPRRSAHDEPHCTNLLLDVDPFGVMLMVVGILVGSS